MAIVIVVAVVVVVAKLWRRLGLEIVSLSTLIVELIGCSSIVSSPAWGGVGIRRGLMREVDSVLVVGRIGFGLTRGIGL